MLCRLLWGLSHSFCRFKYYKELAKDIGFVVPKINEELGFQNDEKIWLIGYKMRQNKKEESLSENSEDEKQQEFEEQTIENLQEPIEKVINLQPSPESRQLLPYSDVQIFATNNDLDISLTDPVQKQVSLSNLREQVYRKFYYLKIFKANSTAKKHKQIRIPQKIALHDLKTKANQIIRMVAQGHNKFRVYTQNDSQLSQKAIKQFCILVGKQPDIEIEQHQIVAATKKRPNVMIDRWKVNLDFYQQAKVDYEQVNRKYKRMKINQKVKKQKGGKEKDDVFLWENFQKEPLDFQRVLLQDLREMRDMQPHKYEHYENMINQLELGRDAVADILSGRKFEGIKLAERKSKKKSEVSQQSQKVLKNEQESQSNSQNDEEFEQFQIDEQKLLKDIRKQINQRTVEQILEDIDKIEENKGELDSFHVNRLKMLHEELHTALTRAGYQNKV